MKQALNTSSNSLPKQDEIKNFKANIQIIETLVKTENIEPLRVVIFAHLVWIKDQNGNFRQTRQGDFYKVNIEAGVITFDKPLEFK